uniref:Invertebrate defensins family profile domain-containing protein n=1 Tax=Anopheles merus TaxID=30066 RepID=A0A2C9H5P9_ANOME
MKLSLPLVLLFALLGLFVTVAVGQTPCSSARKVRCNVHCRGYTKLGSCYDDNCSCVDKPAAMKASIVA